MSDVSYLRVEWRGEVAVVTIERQEKLNALNDEVVGELGEVFAQLGDDDEVGGIILTGGGEQAFVAGADIGELARVGALSGEQVSRRGQQVLLGIERMPKPVLAAVGGFALGGGCELALACHLRIASEDARFGLPEVGIGVIPGYGGTVRLARIVGLGRALEMILTGEPITAEKAEAIGLVTAVVPRARLIDEAEALLRKVTRNGPIAVRNALRAVYSGLDTTIERALALEAALFGLTASTEDMKEGMTAFLEKRRPTFRGR